MGPYKYGFIAISSPSLPYISKCSSPSTLHLSASLSLIFCPYLTCVLYPPNLSMDSTSSCFPLISSHTSFTTLSYLIPARHFDTFSHTAPLAVAGNPFFNMLLTLYYHFNVLTSRLMGGVRNETFETMAIRNGTVRTGGDSTRNRSKKRRRRFET